MHASFIYNQYLDNIDLQIHVFKTVGVFQFVFDKFGKNDFELERHKTHTVTFTEQFFINK